MGFVKIKCWKEGGKLRAELEGPAEEVMTIIDWLMEQDHVTRGQTEALSLNGRDWVHRKDSLHLDQLAIKPLVKEEAK